tara:strand:+ start:1415 stop:3295 length:1881 start_codon:yes stop_codon:yes gene_type:complete
MTNFKLNINSKTNINKEEEILVKFIPPTINDKFESGRIPCDICLVIDTSYSMDTEVTSDSESHGFSILDIVKHACQTIIAGLSKEDRLSIITYSTSAVVKCELLQTTIENKTLLTDIIKSLRTDGQTNIWDGLYKGMEMLRLKNESSRNSSILLLTDGQPNINPPRGIETMLSKYKDEEKLVCSINTFGFGNSLDSKLLNNIAISGNGMYGFIPDSGFVGTVFTNVLTNELLTYGKNLKLSIESTSIDETNFIGNYKLSKCSWGFEVDIGNIKFGQSKDINLKFKNKSSLDSITATYTCIDTNKVIKITEDKISYDCTDIENNLCRNYLVSGLTTITKSQYHHNIESNYQTMRTIIESVISEPTTYQKAIIEELDGQIAEAIQERFYKKWGYHYLQSLTRAHQLQECTNFKDKAVQFYGGEVFNKIRDQIEEIFISLPPPTASLRAPVVHATVAPVSMRSYFNHSGGCFGGGCNIQLVNKTVKISNVKKGDKVHIGDTIGTILYVLKFPVNKYDIVKIDKLLISPYHPIEYNGIWMYPKDINTVQTYDEEYVYNFILDIGHYVMIEGYKCITLGHCIQNHPILSHDFLGTKKVIENVEALPQHEGVSYVTKIYRDADNDGVICEFK